MAQFETLRITSGGATLAARITQAAAKPIVRLHGGPRRPARRTSGQLVLGQTTRYAAWPYAGFAPEQSSPQQQARSRRDGPPVSSADHFPAARARSCARIERRSQRSLARQVRQDVQRTAA